MHNIAEFRHVVSFNEGTYAVEIGFQYFLSAACGFFLVNDTRINYKL